MLNKSAEITGCYNKANVRGAVISVTQAVTSSHLESQEVIVRVSKSSRTALELLCNLRDKG